MSDSAAVRHLRQQVERNLAIAGRIPDSGALRDSLERLQLWQRARLDATYSDLAAQPRFAPACEFFLDELYGGRDVHARDQQLKRVLPVMRRFLPDHLLHAIGEAMRLQAVSLEFDFALAEILIGATEIRQPDYARAYREHGQWEQRLEQIALIQSLGELLDQTVRRTMVRRLVRIMRRPAEMGGAGLLQNFLERGLDAFARMKGAEAFLNTIHRRESEALAAMRSGEDWPFEPWIGRGPLPDQMDGQK